MSTLSYGLNVPKKGGGLGTRPSPAKRKTIFDDESDFDEDPDEDAPEAIDTLGGLSTPSTSTTSNTKTKPKTSGTTLSLPSLKKPPQTSQYTDLSSNHSANKHAISAQELDSNIYDYDAVYDSLHAKPKKSEGPTGPKYMQNLLASAEVRKRDQLRAKEKMLQKEREAEGEEFADKDKFVTGAYKAQQEEVARLEEEERKREEAEAERKRRGGGGMTGLYKGMLEREEKRHEAIAKALKEKGGEKDEEATDGKRDEVEIARDTGAAINDEGQIVDKRQLLGAGLNIIAKPKSTEIPKKDSFKPTPSMVVLQGHGGAKAAMRERQTRMLEAQLEQATKRAADHEEVDVEALQRAAKSKKTEGEVMSAKERYLQRKKAAEEAKVVGKAP